MMKISLQKLLLSLCMVGVTTSVMATPLSDESMHSIFKTLDLNTIVAERSLDQNFYREYATNRVKNFLGLEELSTKEHFDAVTEIQKIYFQLDQQRLQNVKRSTIEDYKKLFQQYQTEEAVRHQLDFLNSEQGKSIAVKQVQRQQLVSKLYQELPQQISQQKQLLDQVLEVVQGGGN